MTEAEAFEALEAREPIFHRTELGTSRTDFERMTDDAFWEVGASGRIYQRDYVLEELEKRHAYAHQDDWQVSDLECRGLGSGVFLVTYLLTQGQRTSRRATLWRHRQGEWKAMYHQGTLVRDA